MGDGERTLTVGELARVVRSVDPGAFVVPGRIVRRAIRHDRELPTVAIRVPHRWSFSLAGARALEVVDRDELGLAPDEAVPATIILLAAPEPDELADRPRGEVLRDAWRGLFHARIHLALDERIAAGALATVELRDRVLQLGPAVFEEARSVLRQEDHLLPPRDDLGIYVEFAAVYLELREFDAGLLGAYFPAIGDHAAVDAVLAQDVDADALMMATRLPGSARPSAARAWSDDEMAAEVAAGPEPEPSMLPSGMRYNRLLAKAEDATRRNNLVRAAILQLAAARLAGASRAGQARSLARRGIDKLAGRLRVALDADLAGRPEWARALFPLVAPAALGFWTAEARLLYDLQKVCFDHERPYYAVDLVEWITSLGKRPIRRLLPDHREVLMVLHLRGAAKHLAAARLPDDARGELSRLLKRSVHRAEIRLRDRFRPKIAAALQETGFGARDLPEEVAIEKLTEELLDRVVARGFLAMGDLRDALSRNNRKLPDLAGPVEFLVGDRLLKADEELAERLDGVYRRGEIYLRGLQRLSALAFGTRTGRFLTRYLALPYGGTAVVLEGLQHVVGPISKLISHHEVHILTPASLVVVGTLALAPIASGDFRSRLGRAIRNVYRVGRDVVVGIPTWLLRSAWVRHLLASRWFAFACRAAILPALLSWLSWLVHPRAEATAPAVGLSALVFLASSLCLTTRAGRDLEELAFDSVGRAWTWLFLSLIPGLFRLVMESFDRVLEGIERVLYTVDEWLRFRGGQDESTFLAKAILGVVWFLVTYVVRFVVTLLVEPQVNPIKHFPVVTVSHKILLTQAFRLEALMSGLFGKDLGLAIAGTVLLLTPGIFGFLVWELKENWRLYEANRPRTLRPVVVGHHGETLARLLRPGFHSGTVPKLFAKLRRAERKAIRTGQRKGVRKHRAHLHEVEESVRHFIDRDFRELLVRGRALADMPLGLGDVCLAAKRIEVEVCRPGHPGPALRIAFEEHSGWVVAGIAEPGWLAELDRPARHAVASALAGLYKMAGVDLVREPIAQAIEAGRASPAPPAMTYDFREEGLVVWPDPDDPAEILYLLRPEPGSPPLVTVGHAEVVPPTLDTARLLFKETAITWSRWVAVWEADRSGQDHPAHLVPDLPMLPRPELPTVPPLC